MSVEKHTPGPWKWFNYPDGRKLLCGRDKAVVHCPDAPITIDEVDANLIAAAPEMYEALMSVVSYFWGADSPVLKEGDVQSFVEDAIAKAEGTENER